MHLTQSFGEMVFQPHILPRGTREWDKAVIDTLQMWTGLQMEELANASWKELLTKSGYKFEENSIRFM